MQNSNSKVEPTTENGNSTKPLVSRSLLLNELERRINWFNEMAKANKGAERKSYEDACTSFVLFKMWVLKQ